jgi:hypothetical protein
VRYLIAKDDSQSPLDEIVKVGLVCRFWTICASGVTLLFWPLVGHEN